MEQGLVLESVGAAAMSCGQCRRHVGGL